MSKKRNEPTVADDTGKAAGITEVRRQIQIFNVGAERMLGYTAAEVMNKLFLCTALNATESLRSTRENQK